MGLFGCRHCEGSFHFVVLLNHADYRMWDTLLLLSLVVKPETDVLPFQRRESSTCGKFIFFFPQLMQTETNSGMPFIMSVQ